MVKFMCVLVLLAASCCALPLEQAAEQSKLPRPSPINPEVPSDPKPTVTPQVSTTESHVQKIPASGVKLSVEVAKNEQTTTTLEPGKDKPKRSLESESTTTTTAKPAFRRNQPTTSTEQPSSTTASSTTSSPVSVKTPVGTTRTKRAVDVTAATASPTTNVPKRTTTAVSPSAVSFSDDKDGPHFVRPVPVQQILKNLAQSEKPASEHRTTEKSTSDHSTTENAKKTSGEEGSSEEKSEEGEESTHPKNHPVIRQPGA